MLISNVIKCARCGHLISSDGHYSGMCPTCRVLDNEDFEKIRQYLYEHQSANANELSDNTGVSISRIEFYLRNGRLEIPKNSPIFIKCELCGTDIRSGRLCQSCSSQLSNSQRDEMGFTEFQVGEKAEKQLDSRGKMHYFNKR